MTKMKNKILCSVLILLNSVFLFAASQYEIQFIKGDINQKTTAVIAAAEEEDFSVALKAVDFALQEKSVLGNDADLMNLLRTAIQSLDSPKLSPSMEITELLSLVFDVFPADDIRISVLDIIVKNPTQQSVTLINNFISDNARKNQPMNSVILKAIQTIGKIGNSTSFQVLLAVSLNQNWSEYNRQLDQAISPLAKKGEKEIIRIMNIAPIDDKLEIIHLLQRIEINSINLLGEVAEIAFAASISNTGNVNYLTKNKLILQYESLELLAKTNWTRASKNATSFFEMARSEYEQNILTAEQFAGIITNIAEIASNDTASVLSSYLNSLNKDKENSNVPNTAVLMAVIKSLGRLGDKTAFDYLLSVTYLDYPEEITNAAKEALAELKW